VTGQTVLADGGLSLMRAAMSPQAPVGRPQDTPPRPPEHDPPPERHSPLAPDRRPLEHDPVVVVGTGIAVPGASTPEEFWQLLNEGADLFVDPPADRWSAAGFHDPDPRAADKSYQIRSGFITSFRPHPRLAAEPEWAGRDFTARWLRHCAYQALDGVARASGDRFSVCVGYTPDGSQHLQEALIRAELDALAQAGPDEIPAQALDRLAQDALPVGGTEDLVSTPYLASRAAVCGIVPDDAALLLVDTACSSSLYAVDLGVRDLLAGRADVALCGGAVLLVGLPVPPDATVLVAGEHGITRGADGPRLTAEEVAGLAADGGSGHIRVLADGSDSDLARAAWSPALRALLHLHEATFLAVQASAPRLDERGSVLVAVLDGVAGQWPKPFTGLFSGLVKSLALEYPRTAIAASLHERAAPADVLPLAAAELAARHLLPVVLHAGGGRLTLRAVAEPAVRGEAPPLPPDALVVAAGGARGIGAAVLAGLARTYRPRLVILGSTVLDVWTEQDLATSAQDRAAFIRRLVAGPDRVAVGEANARFDRLQQARTVAGNLSELRRICGRDRVRYLPCDLRDPEAVRGALADLPGPPDLMLMVAGTNRAGAVATKSRHEIDTGLRRLAARRS
jgi:Beta-ketoacyl synthase, N-terminal domain